MGEIGEVAGAIGAGINLLGSALSRADRDKIENDHNAHVAEIQQAFASRDPDRLWNVSVELCTASDHPPTPGGARTDPRLSISYELFHSLCLSAADAIRWQRYLARAGATVTQK